MKKKGFTLIELLAVILILAIIMVIAVPKILDVIEGSRKSSFENGVKLIKEGIITQVNASELTKVNFMKDENECYEFNFPKNNENAKKIQIKNKENYRGIVRYCKGKISYENLSDGKYKIITDENGNDTIGKEDEKIKFNGILKISKGSTNITYPETDTIEIIENTSKGEIVCESADEEVATCIVNENIVTVSAGKKEGNTVITIKAKETEKYKEAQAAVAVITKKGLLSVTAEGYEGVYDGEPHGITVISSGATIKYGTGKNDENNIIYDSNESPTYIETGEYIVYYKIEKEGYTTVEGSKIVKITKANNTLTLSSNSGNYTYPDSGTFRIIENTSGGTLSCETSNSNVATCSINENIVTVKPGTTEGSATITIKSAATLNYNAVQAAYVAITSKGSLLSYTAIGYNDVYDGEPHGITVSANEAIITYGTGIIENPDGTKTLIGSSETSITRTDAGTTTVYYQIAKAGYNIVTGSKTVIIIPSAPVITSSDSKASNQWHNANFTLSFSGTGYPSDIYYYYGTDLKQLTRGSSITISSETSDTTYYVKACTSDDNCSNTSEYKVKLDKTAPIINSPFSSNGLTKISISPTEIKEVYINNVEVKINNNYNISGYETESINCKSNDPTIAKYYENNNNRYFQMEKANDTNVKYPIAEMSCVINAKDKAGNETTKTFKSFIGNGWILKNDKWYYYNGGEKVTGWNKLYWTRSEGDNKTSEGYRWYYTDLTTGEMYTGWQKLTYNEITSWYYFAERGRGETGNSVITMIIKPDDEPIYAGEMVTGWLKERSTECWYYTNSAGRMVNNVTDYSIDGKLYSFRSSGRCYSGSGCSSTCK